MYSTKDLYNKRVYLEGAQKSIGKVRTFVFYAKRCVGIMVKRPDILWMFRRKNVFLKLEDITLKEKGFYIKSKKFINKKFDWNKCAVWDESPILLNNKKMGYCGNVNFSEEDGTIDNIEFQQSAIAGVVLGKTTVKNNNIKGFSLNKKAIILEKNTIINEQKGGIAETAGKATSIAINEVQKTSDKFHKKLKEFKDEFNDGIK